MNEKKQVNSNPVIGYPANTHVYSLVSQSFDGVNVNIWFIQDANSFPRNTATFTGTISGTNLSGTLQLSRTDGVTCLVRIPINALQTN